MPEIKVTAKKLERRKKRTKFAKITLLIQIGRAHV